MLELSCLLPHRLPGLVKTREMGAHLLHCYTFQTLLIPLYQRHDKPERSDIMVSGPGFVDSGSRMFATSPQVCGG
jgi:hypothetical protein